MHTASSIVSTPAQRQHLFMQSGAVVVEMENEPVRALALRLGVPYVGIRAISDSAEHTLDPSTLGFVNDLGRVKLKALLAEIVWPHYWAIQIILFLLILMYCIGRELVRVIGRDKVVRMFFGPPPLPTF